MRGSKEDRSKIVLETTGYVDSTIIYLMNTETETMLDTGYIMNNRLVFSVNVDEPTYMVVRPIIKSRKDIDYNYF